MSLRIKLLALLAVLACAVVAAPQLATGAKTTTHTINGTLRIAVLQSSASGNLVAGRFTGQPAGFPAMLGRSTITGTTAAVQGRLYGIAGTVKFETTETLQFQPDGSINFTGSGKITGGTGRYAGASGRATFNGTLPPGGNVITLKVRGTIRY